MEAIGYAQKEKRTCAKGHPMGGFLVVAADYHYYDHSRIAS
jgi:hypothetical protein